MLEILQVVYITIKFNTGLSRTRRSSTSIVEGLEIDQLLLIDDEMEERDSNLRKSRRSDEGLVDLDMKTPVTD